MPADAAYGVFEIGMNHAGEIEPLAKMVRPHVAIVTTVEPVHLEYFKDVKADRPRQGGDLRSASSKGGAAVLNRDNPHYALLATRRQGRRRRAASSASASTRTRRRPPRNRRSSRTTARASRRASSASRCPTSSARPAAISSRTASPCSPPSRSIGADLAKAMLALADYRRRHRAGAQQRAARFPRAAAAPP